MPLKVLVVDNQPLIVRLLCRFLEGEGHEARSAENGLAALDILREFQPDVLFVDLVMPGMSGKTLCRIVRHDPCCNEMAIVVLSAMAEEEGADVCRCGADICIAKGPFPIVCRHVRTVLDRLRQGGRAVLAGGVLGGEEIAGRQLTRELLDNQIHKDLLFDHLAEGVLEFNGQGRVFSANRAALRLVDRDEHQVLGASLFELVAPAEQPLLEKMVAEAYEMPARAVHAALFPLSGRVLNLDVLVMQGGATAGGVLVMQDISAFMEAEEALRQRENQYRTLVETVPHGIQENDIKGIITYSNATHHAMLGYEVGELPGKPIWHMAESEEAGRRLRAYFAMLLREQPEPTPYFAKNRTKDGRFIDVQVDWNYKRDDLGTLTGFTAIITDITERKLAEAALQESEERYRDLFENANDLIQILDPQGNLLYVNRAWRQTLGFGEHGVEGFSVFDFMDPEWVEHCRKLFVRVVVEGRVSTIQTVYRTREGKKVSLEGSANCRTDQEGGPLSIRCIFRDVTQQKELEAQLLQSQKMQAIGTLAAGIAHDFNNLLSAIMGYTQLTLHQLPSLEGSHARNLSKVMQSSSRAADLVKQILTFSRPCGEKKLGLSVAPLIKEAIKLLSHSLPATIRIEHRLAPDTPPILADATQIQQVVMNLCTNAYHAMREKGGVLRIACDAADVEDDVLAANPQLGAKRCLRLRVSDTGHGMSPDVVGRIFEPYFTTKGPGEGTGLGLAVVHGIVKDHSGVIRVESEVGKGTDFTLYFPAYLRDFSSFADAQPVTMQRLSATILFVDDNKDLAELGKMWLENAGCRVHSYVDGKEALQVFRAAPATFDLVITDQTMPGLTGCQLAVELLKIRSDLPIFLCTGYSDLIGEIDARSLGIREFLMKPLRMPELTLLIQKHLLGEGHP